MLDALAKTLTNEMVNAFAKIKYNFYYQLITWESILKLQSQLPSEQKPIACCYNSLKSLMKKK